MARCRPQERRLLRSGLVPIGIAACLLFAAPLRAADREEEVFLNRSQELADLLLLLSHPDPGWTVESQCALLDRIASRIEEVGSCFFRGLDGVPREVRRELRSRFEDLPDAVRRAYRTRIDPLADDLWAESLRSNRTEPLTRILTRLPLSSRASDAARALARRHAESGDPGGALLWLREVTPDGRVPTGGDALLMALCFRRIGWSERGAAVARTFAREDLPPRWKTAVAGLLAPAPRRAPAPAGSFLPAPRAAIALAPPLLDPDTLRGFRRAGLRPAPPAFPLLDDRRLFVAHRNALRCFDARSGALLWSFPDDPAALAPGRGRGDTIRPALRGDRVAASFGDFLAVFDASSGKVLWHFGSPRVIPAFPNPQGSSAGDLPDPAVLSPPRSLGDDWIVAMTAERGGAESYLLRFAPDGSLRWSLFLASGPTTRRAGYRPRPRLAIEGAQAFVATGTGAVVAVDLTGPRFVWGRTWPSFAPELRALLDRRETLPQGLEPQVLAPVLYVGVEERGRLLALDSLTGETAWDAALPPGAVFAGVQGGVAVVRGPEEALGFDRWNGRRLWRTALSGGPCAGAPALTPGRVHLATGDGIATLELATGAARALLPLAGERDLNLVAGGEGCVAAGFASVTLLADGAREAVGRPGRFQALLSENRLDEAVRLFEEAPEEAAGVPAELLARACLLAARSGALDPARRILDLLGAAHPGAAAERARALLGLGAAEGDGERLREAAALPPALRVETDGLPWPAATLALAALGPDGASPEDAPPEVAFPVEGLWQRPLTGAQGVPLGVRSLASPGEGVPGAYLGGTNFVERVHPRFGWALWRTPLGGWSRELVAVGPVLVLALLDSIRGLDPETGTFLWSAPLDLDESGAGPFAAQGTTFLVPGRRLVAAVLPNGKAVGLAAADGRRVWETPLGPGAAFRVFQDPETGRATAFFNAAARTRRFHPDEGPEEAGSAFVGLPFDARGGRTLLLKREVGVTAVTLLEADGAQGFSVTVPGRYESVEVDAAGTLAILLPAHPQVPPHPVIALALPTGRERWALSAVPHLREGRVYGDRFFLLDVMGEVAAYDVQTGRLAWSARVGARDLRLPLWVHTGSAFVVGAPAGELVFLEPSSGRVTGRVEAGVGPLTVLARIGDRALLAGGEWGWKVFGAPEKAREFLPLLARGRGPEAPWLGYRLFASAGRAREGMNFVAHRLWEGDAPGLHPKGADHFNILSAAEAAAFVEPPRVLARRFSSRPEMDGEFLEPWSEGDGVDLSLSKLRFLPGAGEDAAWRGEGDLSATLYAGWDEEAFYFYLDLVDDRPRMPHDPDAPAWTGDMLFLAFDMRGDGGFERNRPDDEIVWLFWPGEEHRQRPRPPDDEEVRNRAVRMRPGENGLVIEMAFPWEERFNARLRRAGLRAAQLVPRAGTRFGFNLLYLDDDGRGPGHYLALAPGLDLEATRSRSFRTAAGVRPQLWARVELR